MFGIRSVALIHDEVWSKVEERLGSDYRVSRPCVRDTARRLGKSAWGIMGRTEYIKLLRQLFYELVADVLMHAI